MRPKTKSVPYKVMTATALTVLLSTSFFSPFMPLKESYIAKAEEINPVLEGSHFRNQFGSSYWTTSNLREWLNSNQPVVSYTNQPPSFEKLNNMAYDQEAGFLQAFSVEEQNAIAVTERRELVSDVDGSVKEGGAYQIPFSYIPTSFIDYYFPGIESGWKDYFYKNTKEKVFILSPHELYSYVQKRGIPLKKQLSEQAKEKFNTSSTTYPYFVGGSNSNEHDYLYGVDYDGKIIQVLADTKFGVVPSLHVKPSYVFTNGKVTKDLSIGEQVEFGNYEGSPITWTVINKLADGTALLWAEKALSIKVFDTPGDSSYQNSNSVNFTSSDVSISNDLQVFAPHGETVVPRIYIVNENDLDSRQNASWKLVVEATDDSGIEAIILPDGTRVNSNRVEYEVKENKTYEFMAIDKNGNQGNLSVPIGNINPPSSVMINTSANGWTNKDVTVDIFATNAVVGYQNPLLTATLRDYYGSGFPNYTSYAGKRIKVTGSVKMVDKKQDPGNITVGVGFHYLYRYKVGDGYHYSHTWPTPQRFTLSEIDGVQKDFEFIYTVPGNFYANLEPFFQIDHPHYMGNTFKVEWSNVKYELLDGDDLAIQKIMLPNGQEVFSDSYKDTLTQDGSYTYKVVDNRGMVTEKTIDVFIDKTAPSLSINGNPTQKSNHDAILKVQATDSLSGIKRIQKPNGEWVEGSALDYTIYQNGTYTFKAEDLAGNVTTQSVTVTNIDQNPPSPPVFLPSNTSPTNQDVTLDIQYPGDSAKNEYRINGGQWLVYNGAVRMPQNGTVEARATDEVGNTSFVSRYEVENIDKITPTTPILSPSSISLTNKDVLISVQYPSDSTVKHYRLNGGAWQSYAGTITFTSNGTIEARAFDQAGNISPVELLSVSNIDKTAPSEPILSPSTTSLTNDNVQVGIQYSVDSKSKEYRVNGGVWQPYNSSVDMASNGFVEARATDEAGNATSISSYQVNNIDKVAPSKPIMKANNTSPTNQDVTIEVAYSNDTKSKEVRKNNGAWVDYTTPIVFGENGSLEARAIDEAGNIAVSSIQVGNIDKVAPMQPVYVVKRNENKIEATGDGDAVLLYRLNDGVWTTYEKEVVLADGSYKVEYKAVDQAGNQSQYTTGQFEMYRDALTEAQNKVSYAESNIKQENVSLAYEKVGKLPKDAPEYSPLMERLNDLQALLDAQKAIEKAIETRNEEDVKLAKAKIDLLDNSNPIIIELIDEIQSGYDEADILALVAKERYDILSTKYQMSKESYTALVNIYYAIKYTGDFMYQYAEEKVALVPVTDKYYHFLHEQYDNLIADYGQFVEERIATDAEIKAESSLKVMENNYDPSLAVNTQNLINAVEDPEMKANFQQRLDTAKSKYEESLLAKADQDAITAVEKAESTKQSYYISEAYKKVNYLTNAELKFQLTNRLQTLESQIALERQIADATRTVELAEQYKYQSYIDSAQKKITALPDGSSKTSLQQRLNAVKAGLPTSDQTTIIKKATNYVSLAQSLKTQYYVDKAQGYVNQITDPVKKAELQAKLDAVVVK